MLLTRWVNTQLVSTHNNMPTPDPRNSLAIFKSLLWFTLAARTLHGLLIEATNAILLGGVAWLGREIHLVHLRANALALKNPNRGAGHDVQRESAWRVVQHHRK